MNTWNRFVCLIVLLLLAGLSRSRDARAEDTPPRLPQEAATAVLQAIARGDDEAVKRAAAQEEPDPWLVVDRLLAREARGAARHFARTVQGAEAAALLRYVKHWKPGASDASTRRVLDAAADVAAAGDARRALALLAEVDAQGEAVLPILVKWECASSLRTLGSSEDAVRIFREVATTSEALGWLRRGGRAWHFAGLSAYARGDLQTTRTCWMKHVALQERREDRKSLQAAVGNLAALLNQMGDRDQALVLMERSLTLSTELGDDAAMAKTLFNRGVLFQFQGEPAKALADFERALPWIQAHGGPQARATFHGNLAALHRQLGEADKAVEQSTLALELDRPAGNRQGIVSHLVNRSNALRDLERYAEARRDLEEALELAGHPEGRAQLGTILSDLASLEMETGNSEGAAELLGRALDLAEETGEVSLAVSALHNLGSLHAEAGRLEQALEIHQRALRLAEDAGEEAQQADLQYAIARSMYGLERTSEALQAVRTALSIHLKRLAGLSDTQSASARASYAGQVEFAVAAATNAGDGDAAFEFLEKGRAMALLEALASSGVDRESRVPAALRAALDEARAAEAAAAASLNEARASGRRAAMRTAVQEVQRARDDRARVVGRIQREARAAAAMLFPDVVSLESASESVAADEAFVLYALYEKNVIALVVTRESARLVSLGTPSSVRDAVDALQVEDPEIAPPLGVAALRDALIRPLRLPHEVKRLRVSPDGGLSHVPFGLLAPEREITYVPSATVHEHLRATRREKGTGILALGDPAYGAPTSMPSPRRTRFGEQLVPLPETRKEAKAIGTRVLLGEDATERKFLLALAERERWRAVHLACHGLVDAERPLDSCLALTPGADTDGFLTLADIYLLDVPADLVVLSACETARGTVYEGEGILGLARGFLLAGAPRVLCSLWSVDDEATHALMVEFYARWAGDGTVGAAAALRAAQEHIRSQKKWEHPHYWAAWVLWGLSD